MSQNSELTAFKSVPGLVGVVLHQGEQVLAHEFPPLYSTATLQEVASSVTRMFSGYARVGRHITHGLWKYAEGTLLVLTCYPAKPSGLLPADEELTTPFLTLLLLDAQVADAIISPARAMLSRLAETESTVWATYRQEMLKMLGKVLARAQCEKLLVRVLNQFAPNAVSGIPRRKFSEFGKALIQEIPNRSKHAPLLAELDSILSQLPNS